MRVKEKHLHKVDKICDECGKESVYRFSDHIDEDRFGNREEGVCLKCYASYVLLSLSREDQFTRYDVHHLKDGWFTLFNMGHRMDGTVVNIKVKQGVDRSEIWTVETTTPRQIFQSEWSWAYTPDGQLDYDKGFRLTYRDINDYIRLGYDVNVHEVDSLGRLRRRGYKEGYQGAVTFDWDPLGHTLGDQLWIIPKELFVWQGVPLIGRRLYSFRVPVTRIKPTMHLFDLIQSEDSPTL